MTKNTKATAFLQALNGSTVPRSVEVPRADAPANDQPEEKRQEMPRASSRNGLKHIGGYFQRADVEKIAILRARLGLDNSELIKLAIDDLYRKHEAKRAFGES